MLLIKTFNYCLVVWFSNDEECGDVGCGAANTDSDAISLVLASFWVKIKRRIELWPAKLGIFILAIQFITYKRFWFLILILVLLNPNSVNDHHSLRRKLSLFLSSGVRLGLTTTGAWKVAIFERAIVNSVELWNIIRIGLRHWT